jgi:cell wall-associated NlpC family hydrolase
MSEAVVHRAERVLRALERELLGRFGWTLLDVALAADTEREALVARGTVAAPRLARTVAAALSDVLPEGWRLDVTGLGPLRSNEWRALGAPLSPLWQALPRLEPALTTELDSADGPVELLAGAEGAHLVRAVDATVGWVTHELGPAVSPPRIEPAHGIVDQVVAVARSYSGAPYRLGGASPSGVDCSALVQRAFLRGMGVLLPRHSSDQLQATLVIHSAPRRDGDLVFAWTDREGPCHVGVLAAGESASVIHASLSRKQVVEDPLTRFLEDASRVEFVPLSSVLRYHASNVGRAALELRLEDEGEE